MIRKFIFCLLLLFVTVNGYSHVGSPGVTFEGNAGPYKLIASIAPPDVIPGTALVTVYLEGATKGVEITAKPVYWTAGTDGTPKADKAEPSATQPGRYQVKIWFMNMGTSSIQLNVTGPLGKGTVLVPVMAVSTAKKSMPAGLGWGLLAMAVFLVILMVTIISSSVSDSQLDPAQQTSARSRRRSIIGGMLSFVILVLILWGGRTWWTAAAATYNKLLYRPLKANTTIDKTSGLLTMHIDTTMINDMTRTGRFNITRKMNYIVPDHGKLMHLFMVKAGDMDVFAHLHPRRLDSLIFATNIPDLPAGKYWLYADITRLSGFAETIVDTVTVTENVFRTASNASTAKLPADKDDTYFITNAINTNSLAGAHTNAVLCGSQGVEAKLADGSTAVWVQEPGHELRANELSILKFEVIDPDHKPAHLEPYLGMMAHAVIMKSDGSVYIHLHPSGSYSMGSQKALLDRIAFHEPLDKYLPAPKVFADSIDRFVARLDAMSEPDRDKLLMAGMTHAAGADGGHEAHQISFPYTFPQPGKYRIWIQTKRNGKILNSAFDAEVK